jgi:hypothetical protein
MVVGGLIATASDLRAFTAVTSGSWSNAATWGGVGPGSSVTNQDIIIPSGIAVNMDMDVVFNGAANSFFVTGTLNSTGNFDLNIATGTLTGSGTIDVRKLRLGTPAVYSFTGTVFVDVLQNMGTVITITSTVQVADTLDLDQGAVVLNSGGSLQLLSNSNVRVNTGVFSNSGGNFMTGAPYDVWYVGITKFTGEEVNSASVRDINIMLNSNSEDVMMTGNVTVNGDLNMVTGHLVLNGRRLRLNGDLIRNSGAIFEANGSSDLVVAGGGGPTTSTLEFSGASSLDELVITRDTEHVHLASNLTVTGALRLQEGMLHIDPTYTLTMGNGSLISVTDGRIMLDGAFDGTAPYNVEYIGNGGFTTAEVTGSGLTNLTINLSNPNHMISQASDVTVNGNFVLMNGSWEVYDSFTLDLEGDYHQVQGTELRGDMSSNLILSMATSVDDTLWMAIADPSWDTLIVDLPSSSIITFMRNVAVHTYLGLNGGRVRLVDSLLTIGGQAVIANESDTRYIITEGSGYVRIFNYSNAVPVLYPIGTEEHYCPAYVTNNILPMSGFIRMRVTNGIYSDGETGIDESPTTACVGKTWIVLPDSGVPLNMNFKVGWHTLAEMNMFDRNNAYIKGYWNQGWNAYTTAAAAPASWQNAYELERLGIIDAGAFAVVDSTNLLSIPETTPGAASVYPNPVNDVVNVNLSNPNGDQMQFELYDAAGRRVMSTSNANEKNQFDLRNYDAGTYTMRITNLATNEVTTQLIIKS